LIGGITGNRIWDSPGNWFIKRTGAAMRLTHA
jgi:hypothetical protein